MLLNKDNVKKFIKRKSKVIQFDDFEIKIIAMTIEQQLMIEKGNKEKDGNMIFNLLKFSCVDENDDLFLSDDIINEFPSNFVLQLFEECLNLNNLAESDLENKAKNS